MGFASKVKIEAKLTVLECKNCNKACAKPTFEAKPPEWERNRVGVRPGSLPLSQPSFRKEEGLQHPQPLLVGFLKGG
jgi:hypothetical protein